MTTTKKTAANKAVTDKTDEQKPAPAPAEQIVEQPAPVEPDNDGKVEVICLREFNDLAEDARRHIGDRFRVTPERAAEIIAKHTPELIAVIGGGDE